MATTDRTHYVNKTLFLDMGTKLRPLLRTDVSALMTRSFRVLRLMRAAHSSSERLESLVLQLDFSLSTSWRQFLMK